MRVSGLADDDEEFEEEEEVGELHVQPEQDELKREWLWKSVVPTLTREGWTDRLVSTFQRTVMTR